MGGSLADQRARLCRARKGDLYAAARMAGTAERRPILYVECVVLLNTRIATVIAP
jgi:hypothetical protein